MPAITPGSAGLTLRKVGRRIRTILARTRDESAARHDARVFAMPPGVTYADVGATQHDDLPAGYRHLRYQTRIGTGTGVFEAAAEAVLTWRLHRGLGLRPRATAPRAVPGATVTCHVGVGRLSLAVPCAVVWAEPDGPRRGFGYGTLRGHPFSGEESFVVSMDDDGVVWFTLTSFSRPARWFTRLGGPATPAVQHTFARACGVVLRRLANR
jgi:uncharacterized protein (UPF0548 family)